MIMENNLEKLRTPEAEAHGGQIIDSPFLERLKANLREQRRKEEGQKELVNKAPVDKEKRGEEKTEGSARREARIRNRRFGNDNGLTENEEAAEEMVGEKFLMSEETIEVFNDGLDQFSAADFLWEVLRQSDAFGPSQELVLNVISILKRKSDLILGQADDMEMAERKNFNKRQEKAREIVGARGSSSRTTSKKSVKPGFSVGEITSAVKTKETSSSEWDAIRKESTKIMAYVYDLQIARVLTMRKKGRNETRALDKKIETLRSIAHSESPFAGLHDVLAGGIITDKEYESIASGVHEKLPERGVGKPESSGTIDAILRKYAKAYGEGDIAPEAYFAIDRVLRSGGASAMKELVSAKAVGDIDDVIYNNVKEFLIAAKQKEN